MRGVPARRSERRSCNGEGHGAAFWSRQPANNVSSRTESRAFSFPPQFGGRGTQRGICFLQKRRATHCKSRLRCSPGRSGTLRKNQIVRWQLCRVAAAIALCALALAPARLSADPQTPDAQKFFLHSDWTLQSSCKINATPEQISTPNFDTAGWHSTTVPSTVVAALVADKTYPDPYS